MLTISTSGKLKTTNNIPDTNQVIKGSFNYGPLEPQITLPSTDRTLPPMTLRLKTYDISPVSWKRGEKPSLNLGNLYYRSIAAMYVATTKCGVCSQHLDNTSVGGVLRYHVALVF